MNARKRACGRPSTRLRTDFDHADALFVHDWAGTILDLNRQACESLGYARDELIGRSLRELDRSCTGTTPSCRRSASDSKRGKPSFESSHRRKDGMEFPVVLRGSHDQQPRAAGV